MKNIYPSILGFIFIVIIGSLIIKFLSPSEENPAYDEIVSKQKITFKSSIVENQKIWERAKEYIKLKPVMLGNLEEYKQTDSSLYMNTDERRHGIVVDIKRKRDNDSINFTIAGQSRGETDTLLAQMISLYMQKEYTSKNYPSKNK